MKVEVKRCSGCDARVIWAWSPDDEKLILDAEPNGKGSWVLGAEAVRLGSGEERTLVRASKVEKPSTDQPPLFGEHDGRPRYRSHWKTCPNAGYFKGLKKKAGAR